MLMDLISRGDGVIKYGYFDIKPEIESEVWQVNTDDFTLEVPTNLDATPKKLLCVYIDNKEVYNSKGVAIFCGSMTGNGYQNTIDKVGGVAESVSFLSPEAQYCRYDDNTTNLYIHVRIWTHIKCGKWMWIAIYDE